MYRLASQDAAAAHFSSGAVVKAACLESIGDRGLVPRSGIQFSNSKNVSSPLVKIQYCEEPP